MRETRNMVHYPSSKVADLGARLGPLVSEVRSNGQRCTNNFPVWVCRMHGLGGVPVTVEPVPKEAAAKCASPE